MAKNRLWPGKKHTTPLVKCTAQDANHTSNNPLSGDPVVMGQMPGVALQDGVSGKTVMQIDGIFNLLVAGIDSSGALGADANVAVAGGDKVYFDKTKDPPLSKRAGGIFFGYAFGDVGTNLVASGATTTKCPVKVGP